MAKTLGSPKNRAPRAPREDTAKSVVAPVPGAKKAAVAEPTIDPKIAELKCILDEHLKLHSRLLELAREQTSLILSRDDANLTMVLKEQEKTLERVRELESSRMALTAKLAAEAGIATESITLRELLEVMPAEAAEIFRDSLTGLSRVIEDLAIVNQANSRLLAQASAYADLLISAATGKEAPARAYGPTGGKAAAQSRRSLIDRQA